MTLRPLVSQSRSYDSGVGWSMLSPANKQSAGFLLELALQIGITVSLIVRVGISTFNQSVILFVLI